MVDTAAAEDEKDGKLVECKPSAEPVWLKDERRFWAGGPLGAVDEGSGHAAGNSDATEAPEKGVRGGGRGGVPCETADGELAAASASGAS